MDAQTYVAVVVGIITIAGTFIAVIQWLVKHYLNELKPNGGNSLNDRVTRLEAKIELIHDWVKTRP